MTRHPASSLRRQLLGWLLVATAVFGILALFDTYREAMTTANTISDRVLAGSALAIAERVVVNENGALEVDIPYVALEMLTSAAQDRVFYRVEGPPGHFITGYQALPTIADTHGQPTAYADATFRGEPIRVAVLQRSASTGVNSVPFVVTVAETTIARRQLAQAILVRSALRLGLMIAGAAAIVWIAVTLALRPLYRLSDAIAERNPSDLHPIDQQVPSEVQGLVDTVNSFMVRLQSALDALRHFSGNASHQLRTPLAIIRTQLALAGRASSLAAAQEAARKGDEAVAHAERILAQLLLMAKIDAAGSVVPRPGARIDIASLARNLTAEYVPVAAQSGIDLGFEGDGPAMVRAEPLLFGEMLRNLIENAIAYAGQGAEVTVSVRALPDGIRLCVEDDGPGIPPERRGEVLQRFARGGQDSSPGVGLGLPIVEDIAALFGAKLTLEDAVRGKGLAASIMFPACDPEPVSG
ncbi:sensor histidine kinase [Mycoplana dimorpha]|uniref:histidine kinase n=1 Tax=Mycoplana dimorpha TaxID=28320 RepID=A0A2T5BBL3_MYCDI|nr:sensor histidine kinase [Mycoplana dimorpha]PTM96369.1 two-component system sensor histidine kinase TctE [Mycoplana dimorpha]